MQRAQFALLFKLMLDGPSARLSHGTTTGALVFFALFGVTLAFGLGACAANGAVGDDTGAGASGGTGHGGMAGAAGFTFTLGLDIKSAVDDHTLDPVDLTPGEAANLVVTSSPPAMHTVRFALLGDPLDAVLGTTDADTDPDTGMTTVGLTTPSTPTGFSVRASSNGAAPFTLDLAVKETNMATLSVKPSYPGERVLSGYVASATPDETCADLAGGSPPDDGPLSAPSTDTWPIALEVPTGVKLAVLLRAEKFAWGCTTLNDASEGMPNVVEVLMANVSMKLDSSNVGFELDLDSFDDFDQALSGPTDAITSALVGSATDDVEALLDAMGKGSNDARAFADARNSKAWDDALRTALGSNAASVLRGPLGRWIQAGMAAFPTSGGLTGTITGSAGGAPSISLGKVFGLAASRSGFAPSGTASWEAGADDRIVLGMSMKVNPTAFLLAEALAAASDEVAGAPSLAVALSDSVPCSTVATTLVAAGVSRNHSTAECDAACTEQLCVDAVQTLTDAFDGLDADGGTSALDVALTASGTVGATAELANFSGRWLGHFTTPDGSSSLTGAATSTPPQ